MDFSNLCFPCQAPFVREFWIGFSIGAWGVFCFAIGFALGKLL